MFCHDKHNKLFLAASTETCRRLHYILLLLLLLLLYFKDDDRRQWLRENRHCRHRHPEIIILYEYSKQYTHMYISVEKNTYVYLCRVRKKGWSMQYGFRIQCMVYYNNRCIKKIWKNVLIENVCWNINLICCKTE